MPGPAEDICRRFGAVEDDQRYTRLVERFTDDAIYYDPFMGPQRGREAIREFMGHMEHLVPKAGVRFEEWTVQADTTVGWATWNMVAPGPDGTDVAVPGQSLYRLTPKGKVTFVADYVDNVAQRKLRPEGPRPDLAGAGGLSAGQSGGTAGSAFDVVREFWTIQDERRYEDLAALFTPDAVFSDQVYGRFEGHDAVARYLQRMETEMPEAGVTFELIDMAGEDTVAWSQWWCNFPNGRIPGWTLYTARDGQLTLDADFFDVIGAAKLRRG
jgi:ketosteroid isomerase-like protein